MPAQYPGNSTTKAARAKAGGGFESAIEEVVSEALSLTKLDGDLNNGSRVRISTDGTYAIGTKSGGAHELHDFVHTSYERGTENTFNTTLSDGVEPPDTDPGRVWTDLVNASLTSNSADQRHQNASRVYKLIGEKASLREPKGFQDNGGRTAGYNAFYHARWQKVKYNATGWRDCNPADAVGTFEVDEPLSVGGGVYTGVFVGFDSGRARPYRVVIENGSKNNNNLVGETVTGLNSGATFTFPSDSSLPGQYKIGRWWANPDGSEGRSSIAINDGFLTDITQWFDTVNLTPNKWMLFEIELNMDAGYYRHMVDGRVRTEQSGIAFSPQSFSYTVSQVGTDGQPFEEQITYFSEQVFDASLYRVYLSDSPTWSLTSHREVQRLINWDGHVDIALNYGSLNQGWLYLIGSDGQPINTAGLEVA